MLRYNPTGVGLSAPQAPLTQAGLRLLRLQGVWVTHAPQAAPAQPSWLPLQLQGIWVSSAPEAVDDRPAGRNYADPLELNRIEEEEIMMIINSFLFMRSRND